jgi:Ser/Thr protein kinase RdoA (MazF antagonist)
LHPNRRACPRDAVELPEAALKTRLLTERDVSAAQARPAKSGEELENLRDRLTGDEPFRLTTWASPPRFSK